MKSNFKNDKRAEKALGEFLDTYMYGRALGSPGIKGYERVNDIYRQKQGIDVIIHTNKKDFNFDEKSTLQYINRNLPTFAFELYYSGGTGWFLKDLATDVYCLVWPNACTTDLSKITADDFDNVDVMFVPKANVKAYVNKFISDKDLYDAAVQASEDTLMWRRDDKGRYRMAGCRLYLTATKHLYEKPVNLIIYKDILQSLCCREMKVSKEGIEVII